MKDAQNYLPLNKPFLPLVVSRGYGLSANKPMAITPQTPLAPILQTNAIVYYPDGEIRRKKLIKI